MSQNSKQKHCEQAFCKQYANMIIRDLPKRSTLKKRNFAGNKIPKMFTQSRTVTRKEIMKDCTLQFCNTDCKGTILEKGRAFPTLHPRILSQLKLQAKLFGSSNDDIKHDRRQLFGNKTNILRNSVHYKTPRNLERMYKKKGALSICQAYAPGGTIEFFGKKLKDF